MTRRVLLTGTTGFIGRHAVQPLLDRGFEVHAVSRGAPAVPGAHSHAADLLDPAAARALVAEVRPSHLLHLAWDVTPGRFWSSRSNLDWMAASLHLYRSFLDNGGVRAAVAGTCAEYDWSSGTLDEGCALRPATLYGAAKHGLHVALAAAGGSLAWGRVFLLYGPHEPPVRLVPSVVVPLLRGEPAMLGDGRAVRDFMHVHDVAAALAAVLDSAHEGGVNIASGQALPIREMALAVAAQIGQPGLLRFGTRPTPAGEPPLLGTSAAVLGGLGFTARFGLHDGLADTIAWWRGQP